MRPGRPPPDPCVSPSKPSWGTPALLLWREGVGFLRTALLPSRGLHGLRWGWGKRLLDRIYNTDASDATNNAWHLRVAGVPADSVCRPAEQGPSLLFLKTRTEEGDFCGGSAAPHFPHSSRWVRDTGGKPLPAAGLPGGHWCWVGGHAPQFGERHLTSAQPEAEP